MEMISKVDAKIDVEDKANQKISKKSLLTKGKAYACEMREGRIHFISDSGTSCHSDPVLFEPK